MGFHKSPIQFDNFSRTIFLLKVSSGFQKLLNTGTSSFGNSSMTILAAFDKSANIRSVFMGAVKKIF